MKHACYPEHPILLVDDEINVLKSFSIALKTAGINNLRLCEDSRGVFDILAEQSFDLLMLDLTMPHVTGQEILEKTKEEYPELPVIIVTGLDEVETAVWCMQHGAMDYLLKPVDKQRLISGVRHVLERCEMRRENERFRKRVMEDRLSSPEAFVEIITQNKTMRAIFQYAESIAPSPEPVLITGETGVGKELMASALHTLSGRTGACVKVNVAGLDEQVFSDTLFGHRKGAFTGAMDNRAGMVERAASGTLFLDEIGDLQQTSQVKLLRLIQEGEYLPLGADVPRFTNTRIITSTNRDPSDLMKSGVFRKDLYYRLNAHHIHIPPLRKRMDDLGILLHKMFEQTGERLQRSVPAVPPALLALLRTYSFPGNIRELQAMIADALSAHRGGKLSLSRFKKHIDAHAEHRISAEAATSSSTGFPEALDHAFPTLQELTRHWVREAMKRAGGNQTVAARLLGISQPALSKRLKKMQS